ncbi:hypothetical protein ETB97_006005 [Aspergillus alliaceus]|uniref:2EXR domain-containing protein n=1 Tax=Petromyces alliaceus TaxID=209559 RepID=A0A5N6FXX3_PETAA|nr:uncharacterized protein BDW43DRAFT_274553 [Aspergillus alliaceus]KAB8234209.1 hypothetical protein BDW43DRAFT_274553 [Aspergillus alliaceus]KAE8394437.1 hypothetical protein BDV23DRAFT_147177 [Aspergillus alliaceus]KAF5857280.1 hypothetical protein ETB97_006005 [Aspergillus burnettii]
MPATFHQFQALPAEIRHYIWHLSLIQERVIHISCDRGILPTSRRYARCFRANRANPPQLQVNMEARHESLRLYTPYFGTEHAPHGRIYLAPERDVVHLHEAVLAYLGDTERATLQRLMVDIQDYMTFGSYWMDRLRSMGQLKELVLVVLPLTSSPPWVSNQPLIGDEDIIGVLKDAFVEGVRTSPKWLLPQIQVRSHTGATMGRILVEADDIETGVE